MAASVPPKPAPKPGRVKVYRALYDYTAKSALEMSFSEGDIIYVSDSPTGNGDWLSARCGKSEGLVPVNYVLSENVEQLTNPLHEAAKRGNMQFLQECLNNQVSVNSLDRSGSTALYWASHGGHLPIVIFLLAIPNISVSSQNKIGDTALHAAAWRGHTECVSLLLEAGANPRVRNKERKMPIEQAKDVYVAALLQSAMRTDTTNEEEANEYESGSDEDSSASHPARF